MATADGPSSPANWLRDSFEDPKPLDISRKITACVACRKQKIKCQMSNMQPPCARCRKKGLPCTINRNLQMLLENDVTWKQAVEKKIQRLEETVATLVKDDGTSSSAPWQSRTDSEIPSPTREQPHEGLAHDDTAMSVEEASRWKIVIDLESSPGALPGHYLHAPDSDRRKDRMDIISRGLISAENAQKYFSEYQNRLDHFLYGILGDHSTATLGDTREKLPLLTAAVCTVGALHLASPDYDLLYKEFVALSAGLSFSKRNTIDDVRALCIGAFWLSDLSWSLVGLAVRIATELQLHRSFREAVRGDREHYTRMRLYYLVYACDHHFSVPYGRPPITRECQAVRDSRKFLDCAHATENDARLVSHVLRWSLLSNVYDTFGPDVQRPLSDAEISLVRRFGTSLDNLRAEWADRFGSSASVGNYPNKGVGMQYHFAKLYLCSHAFRGAGSTEAKSRAFEITWEVDEIANLAVASATSILRVVVADQEIQSYLNGLPTYFHIMIAFAIVFLLKVSWRFTGSSQVDLQEVHGLMTELAAILKRVTESMNPHHILVSITKDVNDLLQQSGFVPGSSSSINPVASQQQPMGAVLTDAARLGTDFNFGADGVYNQYLMSGYDFLLGQGQGLPP